MVGDMQYGARMIFPQRCRIAPAGDVQCVVVGQLVAIWTGPEQFGLSSQLDN